MVGGPMKCAAILLLAGLYSLGVATTARAQVFHEDFDGSTVDGTKWEVTGFGLSSVSGGKLHLVNDGCGYPYLVTRQNPFPPAGDFFCRTRFRFTSVQRGGNGLGTNENGVFA